MIYKLSMDGDRCTAAYSQFLLDLSFILKSRVVSNLTFERIR